MFDLRNTLVLVVAGLFGCTGTLLEHPQGDDDADVPGVTTIAGSPGGPGHTDGVGNDALFYHPYGIALDGDTVYLVDGWGQSIRTFRPDTGTVTTLAGVAGEAGLVDSADGPAQFDYPCGVDVGPDGLLYVADRKNGRIRVVDPANGDVWSLADQDGVIEAVEPYDVAFDDEGNLYFTDLLACLIRRVNIGSGESQTVVGRVNECVSLDGNALEARLGEPRGLAYHPAGILFVTDRVGENVRMLELETGYFSTAFGSVGDSDFGFVDGVGNEARFHKPTGLVVDGQLLYIADSDNDAIRVADLTSGEVVTLAGIGINGNADGPGDEASFSWPVDLIVAPDGSLLVVDPGGHSLRRVDLAHPDHTVTTVAGAVGNAGADDGIGGDARMSEPRGLARGEGDQVWLLDSFNLAVRTLDLTTNEVVTVAGTPELYGHDDGVGADAHFMTPSAGVMHGGTLYIVGTDSHTIRALDPATAEVVTIAGSAGLPGYADGIGGAALFNLPRDIVDAGDGYLYVLENGNHCIRRLDPDTAEITTLLAPDDPGNTLRGPEGMVYDGAGTFYVTDYAMCTLSSVDLATGQVEPLAGAAFECQEQDGIGDDARFDRPAGLDVDPSTGLIYVASLEGHTVRIFDPETGAVSTLTGDPEVMGPVDGPLDQATFSTPVDVLVLDGSLLVLDRYAAHVRRVDLPVASSR